MHKKEKKVTNMADEIQSEKNFKNWFKLGNLLKKYLDICKKLFFEKSLKSMLKNIEKTQKLQVKIRQKKFKKFIQN